MSGPSPPEILALARAGATDRAWQLLLSIEDERTEPDPAISTLKGRLLKDRAARVRGDDRRQLYREAAAAYQRAAELRTSTYPLINAATLSLLAGEPPRALKLAQQVLETLDAEPQEPETPYWRSATRAEALLLLGREDEARAAFAQALSLAPRAWEDHASTLRQFALISEEKALDSSWLEGHRPPRSLHFGGHMSFAPETARRHALQGEMEQWLQDENVGFGYGALAAGADIIVAEALLARGAELHVILPGSPDDFAASSVDSFGESWSQRYRTLLDRAETVRSIRSCGPTDGSAIILSDEVAMGTAAMNARRLAAEALQLLILAPEEDGRQTGTTQRAGRIWIDSGRRQHALRVPRETIDASMKLPESADQSGLVVAVIAIGQLEEGSGPTSLERQLESMRDLLETLAAPSIGPYWAQGLTIVAYERLGDAAVAALALARRGFAVGGHYLSTASFVDPFSKAARLPSAGTGVAQAAVQSAPSGSACVSEDFATALEARGNNRFGLEFVGELTMTCEGAPLGLYAIR